jgi:hypothetical protein
MNDKETLLNLRYVNGVLKQVFIDKDGKEVIKDIEGTPPPKKPTITEFENRFVNTTTIPTNDVGPKTSPLIKKNIAKQYTAAVNNPETMMVFIQQQIDRTIEYHAMLIEILGAPENFTDERARLARESLNKNPALKAYVIKHLKLMGEVWGEVYKKLTD